MRIAILGGYGNAGLAVARMLRMHTGHDLLLLGRDRSRLDSALAELAHVPGEGSLTGSPSPADPGGLSALIRGQDLLIVAAPLSDDIGPWARAALAADCDWLDVLLSVHTKWAALRALAPEAERRGLCLVTDGGVHPGVPGALIRLAARRIGATRAHVAMRFGVRWNRLRFSPETIDEFAEELLRFDPRVLRDGAWVRGWKYAKNFDFGPPVGGAYCAPMYLEELGALHEEVPLVRDAGFFVAGFGPVLDYGLMPLASALAWTGLKKAAGRVFSWGLQRYGTTSGPSVILLEAEGANGAGLRVRLECADAYDLTAAPAVAAVGQWAERRRPGLTHQAAFLDPERLLADLPALGVAVSE